ncbi:MAG: type I-E CRISPR-associated protein Cse1/CasA [Aquabacterium sp.]
MSLLTESWMPVRTRSGERRWISPDLLSDPDVVAFDADRADFNGALAQFAIGLLATYVPMQNSLDWQALFKAPPDRAVLRRWLQPGIETFVYEGDGARFMQDKTLAEAADSDIAALLIDSPGENAIKNNSDHFVQRGRIQHLCPHCAVTALLTLQINAPAGGAGHRTGLRGGGPLTTLVACQPPQSLWHDLWLNVLAPPHHQAFGGDTKKTASYFIFPWLADVSAIQPAKGETAPIQTHPLHIFWAMPRRIRLDFAHIQAGHCDICHQHSERLISRYATKPYGLNYKGPWDHVLSPYYETKEGWLPLHPQPGGFGYRHWLAWVLGAGEDKQRQRPARIVEHHRLERRHRVAGAQFKLWAFGYDMDNMKARCWYEASLPLYNLDDCPAGEIRQIEQTVNAWLDAARFTLYALRAGVKSAWFGLEARGDFSMVDASFWSQTEADFYKTLQQLIEAARNGADINAEALSERWLTTLIASLPEVVRQRVRGSRPD